MSDLLMCLLLLGSTVIVPFVLLLGGCVMRNMDSARNRYRLSIGEILALA